MGVVVVGVIDQPMFIGVKPRTASCYGLQACSTAIGVAFSMTVNCSKSGGSITCTYIATQLDIASYIEAQISIYCIYSQLQLQAQLASIGLVQTIQRQLALASQLQTRLARQASAHHSHGLFVLSVRATKNTKYLYMQLASQLFIVCWNHMHVHTHYIAIAIDTTQLYKPLTPATLQSQLADSPEEAPINTTYRYSLSTAVCIFPLQQQLHNQNHIDL